MNPGWVRLTRTCNNACLFCLDADNLDGRPVELAEITADIDAVADRGAREVILSGGEPTLSRHLLAAIKHAKARGLYVILTTNARIIQTDRIAGMLAAAGLDEIRVSMHAARRQTHETLVGAEKAWVETNQAIKCMGRTSVKVVANVVMTRPGEDELAYLMHLLMMGGMKELRVRALQPLGRAATDVAKTELLLGAEPALRTISDLWYNAKEEGVNLIVEGYDDSVDLGVYAERPARQADIAGLTLLRQRVQINHLAYGSTLLDEEGMAKDLNQLIDEHGPLSEVAHELAARGAPLVDGPPCLGARPMVPPTHWGDDALYADACAACRLRPGCPGLPRKLTKRAGDALGPLTHWDPAPGPFVVVAGTGDALLDELVLPDLVAALRAEGADATLLAAPSDALVAAGTVICAGPQAAAVLGWPGRPAGQRVEVLDTDLGASLVGLPAAPSVVRSHVPGRVERLRAAGVALRTVHWRPAPAPAAAGETGPMQDGVGVVAFGHHASWRLLVAARQYAGNVPPFVVFDTSENPAPEHPGLVRHTDASPAARLAAIQAARVVCYPFARGDDGGLADDLRWLSVAIACGRPVVATRGSGVEDTVRHGRSGWLVRPGDHPHLGLGLRDAHNTPARTATLAKGAAEAAPWASPASWARELLRGAPPTTDPLWRTALRPWPRW